MAVGYSFLHGALVLLMAGLVTRILGFFYQMAMIRLIGPEGVGLFNMVFPVYIMVLVLATAGIPLAVAKLVAEEVAGNNLPGAYGILVQSIFVLVLTSLFCTCLLVCGVPLLKSCVFPNPKVYYCFVGLIPGIVIVSLCSAFRGFFQGLQQMTPTAVTQTVEQLVRVVAGLSIACLLLPRGIEYAAVGLSLGVVLGELSGFLLMLRIFFKHRTAAVGTAVRRFPDLGLRQFLSRAYGLAVPVTLTRFVATALMSVQAVLIPLRLHVSGLSISQATSVYGQFVGIAETLLFIPGVLTMALATALVPAISDAMALRNLRLVRERVYDAVRLTIQVGMPAAFIFLILADELCGVLFRYPEAGVSLRIMALAGPFLYLQQTTTGIMQGMGRADIPFKNLVISSAVSLTGIYYLTAVPLLAVKGTALAVALGFVVMSLLNLQDLHRLTGFYPGLREHVLKPLLSVLCMSLLMLYLRGALQSRGLDEGAVLFVTLLAGGLTYLACMLLSGGFNEEDKVKFKAIFRL